jgi:hypothetical protein
MADPAALPLSWGAHTASPEDDTVKERYTRYFSSQGLSYPSAPYLPPARDGDGRSFADSVGDYFLTGAGSIAFPDFGLLVFGTLMVAGIVAAAISSAAPPLATIVSGVKVLGLGAGVFLLCWAVDRVLTWLWKNDSETARTLSWLVLPLGALAWIVAYFPRQDLTIWRGLGFTLVFVLALLPALVAGLALVFLTWFVLRTVLDLVVQPLVILPNVILRRAVSNSPFSRASTLANEDQAAARDRVRKLVHLRLLFVLFVSSAFATVFSRSLITFVTSIPPGRLLTACFLLVAITLWIALRITGEIADEVWNDAGSSIPEAILAPEGIPPTPGLPRSSWTEIPALVGRSNAEVAVLFENARRELLAQLGPIFKRQYVVRTALVLGTAWGLLIALLSVLMLLLVAPTTDAAPTLVLFGVRLGSTAQFGENLLAAAVASVGGLIAAALALLNNDFARKSHQKLFQMKARNWHSTVFMYLLEDFATPAAKSWRFSQLAGTFPIR